MREHCFKGYQIVKKIPFLAEACDVIYSHQERWDGTGYPRGLKGKDIPLGARIFSVADTLDAITSDRPYRAARSLAVARKEIQDWSGKQFDPEVVAVFQQMPDEIFEELRRAIGGQGDPLAYSASSQ
jgi:HD-GYP domain-containing protein (c-di-GMP phosphodiesterase class II)